MFSLVRTKSGLGKDHAGRQKRQASADRVVPKSISPAAAVSTPSATIVTGNRLPAATACAKGRRSPLVLASFANTGIEIADATGAKRTFRGLYAVLSNDGGKTWPHIRLISDYQPDHPVESTDGGSFVLNERNSEYRG
ncbi:MAG: hypothetical protein ACYTEL_16010 [Planctomycetota bacterium]